MIEKSLINWRWTCLDLSENVENVHSQSGELSAKVHKISLTKTDEVSEVQFPHTLKKSGTDQHTRSLKEFFRCLDFFALQMASLSLTVRS